MTSNIISRPPQTGQQIVDLHAADTLEIPMLDVGSGVTKGQRIAPKLGDRYVVVFQQGPFGSPFVREHLTADLIDPKDPGFLGLHPDPGFQWGFDDDDDEHKFAFTVIGVYIMDSIVPNMADLTFSAMFHREPQEATA